MKKLLFGSIATAILSLFMVGCGGGGTPPPTAAGGKVVGKIVNYDTDVGLAGATVKAGNKQTTTSADGSYTLTGVANGSRVVVTASKDGFALTSKIVTLSDTVSEASLNMSLLPVEFTGTFDAAAGATINVPGSPARVVISGGSLVDANGNPVTGTVTAELTPINPAIDINLMPGDMTVSSGDPIASYGALTVEFSDAAGNPLNLGTGESATIRIPVSNRGGVAPSATISLFYFDESTGAWKEEGTASLSADGTYYEGTVTHFTTWNADYLYTSVTISGCVVDEDGSRVANAHIGMEGFSYSGMASATTDANGDFVVDAMKDGISLVVASTSDKVSNTVKVITSSNMVLNDCLILGEVPLTVRLTWGQNPRDLDTHVIGPNNYHIWYVNTGSLTSNEFAQLDVDDTSSYGPEVFTALSFPQAGTYHYAVYHYAGSSTISASPARVELTLNGNRTVFTPPVGQGANDTWWNVFDIIVDASGNISITSINTWSSDATGPSSDHKLTKMVMPSKK